MINQQIKLGANLLSIYMIITFVFVGLGQLLIKYK